MFCRPRPAAIGVAVALVFSLAACQAGTEAASETSASQSASPTPTTPPSSSASLTPEDPAEAAKAKNIAEAEQRYLEYQAIASEHAKKGENPFWVLMSGGYVGSAELQESEKSYWEQFADLGLKETGNVSIDVVEVTRYEGDPLKKDVTGQRVRMEACIDSSGADVVRPDGTSTLQKGGQDRVLMKVTMQGQQGGLWSVNENTPTGKKC